VVFAVFFLLAARDQLSITDKEDTGLQADSIYHNVKVYTVNESAPWAEAVAIKGDGIVLVGSDHDALALTG